MSDTDVTSSSSDEEGPAPPAKRRRIDSTENFSFKQEVETIFTSLSDAAPGEFAVFGKIEAPVVTIALKNNEDIVHFPLYENEAIKIMHWFQQSPFGKGQETIIDTTVRNSYELNADRFEILNPSWNDFVSNEVVARIKEEMFLEFPFTASLHKLLLYKSGSFFKPHRDSEKLDGMFATLVMQLPSLYKGGQLIVRHDGKMKTSDFSADTNNEFHTFFNAFYCDCEHEVLEVTEGYRVCLVYNLISQGSVVTPPRRHTLEMQFINLLNNWQHPGKLVYSLKHKYSESSLSLSNLKSSDREIANFLINFAKAHDLSVYVAIFNRKRYFRDDNNGFYGRHKYDYSIEVCNGPGYNLSNLIAIHCDYNLTNTLHVDFQTEVIPEDCFANIELYDRTEEHTGNEGIEVCKHYRCAAIVFWPNRFLFEVLKAGRAELADLKKVFLKRVKTNRGQVNDDNVKAELKKWANEIISSGRHTSLEVIKAIVEMEDICLIQSLFSNCVKLNKSSTALLLNVCEKYGWEKFPRIPRMFDPFTTPVAIQFLEQLCTGDMSTGKKNTVRNVMQVILKKLKNMNDALQEQTLLLSVCRLAEKSDFNLLNFAKSKSAQFFVPILFRLVPEKANSLIPFWKDVAMHFFQELKTEAAKSIFVPNWQRNDQTNCSCIDCTPLNTFLASDEQTIRFEMDNDRRRHLHEHMHSMKDVSHVTDRSGPIGVLVIKKTSKTGSEELAKIMFAKENVQKLSEIIPEIEESH